MISVIILTWNSAIYLPRCLLALNDQTYHEFEVRLIDNGSTDGTLDEIEERYPDLNLHIERLGTNQGFAVANNLGARQARGQWLALLNADVFPEPDWLECLFEAASKIPNAFFTSRQIQANSPGILDGEGDSYHISGLAWRRNYGLPVQDKFEIEEIFSSCAAAAFYPRQAFLEVGGFDEDYFSYHEDVDLGFRLRQRGLRCYFVPQAVVYHVGSASIGKESDFSIYYGRRNLVWTYVKNMPAILFWIFLPIHVLLNIGSLIRFSAKGYGRAIWRAKIDAIRGLNVMLRKRKKIQQNSLVSIAAIYRVMERDLFAPLRVYIQRRHFGSD